MLWKLIVINASIINLYGCYVVLGDIRGLNNDLVISTEGVATDAIVLYKANVVTAPADAGVIEYRMFGIGHWGPIVIGQFGGPNNWTDCANWILTGTPDTWSHGWIMMYEGTTYSASGTVTFTGTPGNGRKFEIYGSTVTTGGCQGAAPAAPGGIDFFPGTTPGVWDPTSTYDGVAGTLLYNADESRARAEKIIGKIKSDFDALVKKQGEKNDRQRSLF